jgi:cell division protease FtsH
MDKKSKSQKKQSKNMKNLGFIAIIILIGLTVAAYLATPSNLQEIPISEARTKTNNNEVSAIVQKGNDLSITLKDQSEATLTSVKEEGTLQEQGFENGDWTLTVEPQSDGGGIWTTLLLTLLPIAIIIGFFYFMMRQAQGQGNQAMNFGKSKAKLFGGDKENAKFKDIAGNDEAKQDLEEVVEFLKFPKKFEGLGAKIPKGVLLVGPPGTGKTMLARSVAGEAGVPFFSISGSEFVEMFVGVGASRVRDLFAKAKKNSPCIIFIDEIDAVGRRRGSGMGGGHDEREQTLNQILVEMDGFEQGTNVIVLAATNRADVLDPALLRPGRFDRRVGIGLPDRRDREAILKVHFKKKPIEATVDLDALAAKTAGSSGADLANIANEAAIIAARANRKTITNDDVTAAFEKVAIGPERKNKIMSEKEKQITAYHEAGHAIVSNVLPDADDTHKVTIIPRGGTGGVTWSIPPEDKSYHSIIEYKDILARMLGGRVAEKIVNGEEWVTTGAGSDLRNAHGLAREMIVEQGMGKNLRDQVFHQDEGGMMFDRMVHDRPYSEETAKQIDAEVETLIKEAAVRAEAVISANRSYLDKLKDALLKKETLDAKEVATILKGAKLPAKAKLY